MFKVYWTDIYGVNQGQEYADLSTILDVCESLRKSGMRFVTMVSENVNQVGQSGAAMMETDVMPDGSKYDGWIARGK